MPPEHACENYNNSFQCAQGLMDWYEEKEKLMVRRIKVRVEDKIWKRSKNNMIENEIRRFRNERAN